MYSIATLANEHAVADLAVLFFTLELWTLSPPTIYIFSDAPTIPKIEALPYKGKKVIKDALAPYIGLNRATMERTPGKKFKTLFADFCAEKPRLMAWALDQGACNPGPEDASADGVLFLDSDICHLGPLPSLASEVQLALSPHMIRKSDTDRFGVYNAGYLFLRSKEIADKWYELCATSRFFEQGCLEDLAKWVSGKWSGGFEEFPVSVNYGWWRLWQGDRPSADLQKEWRILRRDGWSGLAINSAPVQSIHTHWHIRDDMATMRFNIWILGELRKLTSVKKTAKLVAFLEKIVKP
jgi:hypothetical protein